MVSDSFRIIGRPTVREDALDKLTGATRYAGDLSPAGLVYAAFARSPFPSARIRSVNLEASRATAGVVAVYTARDLPVDDVAHLVEIRKIPLALDRVRYAGQPVAVVVGETMAAAEDGAAAVQVAYEPLPVLVNPTDAAAPGAPVVAERWEQDEEELGEHGAAGGAAQQKKSNDPPNVTNRSHLERGDVARGFAGADVVVEREYRTSWIHQTYLEPQTSMAMVDPFGSVTVATSSQTLFAVRDDVARALRVPEHQVRVHAMPVGGAFGGKWGLLDVLAAALARALRRPVLVIYNRMDEFFAANPGPQSIIRVKVGARSDGTLTTLEANLLFDAGSRPGSPLGIAGLLLGSYYRWQDVRIDGTEVLTHKPGAGAYRAPGAPQATFAVESTVDEVARTLGVDPFEIRRKNAVRDGDLRADGRPWARTGLVECLERAEPLYRAELAAARPGEGVGIALGGWPGGLEPAAALCQLEEDGTIEVTVGSVDLTGTNTTFQMIAAEAFGLSDPREVRIRTADSQSAPHAGGSGGSKITFTVGPAVLAAAQDARRQVLEVAANELEASVDDLEIADGHVQVVGVPERQKSLREIWRLCTQWAGKYPPILGRGGVAISRNSPGFAVHIARVRVDRETGLVEPVRYISIQDVGRALNPAGVEGQLLGGVAQSIGWGLLEQMRWDQDGSLLTTNLSDYQPPTASVMPEIQTEIVEVPSPDGPYGAKCVGEPPVIPGAAALANAVRDAIGLRLTELPLTPERVYQALQEQPATNRRTGGGHSTGE